MSISVILYYTMLKNLQGLALKCNVHQFDFNLITTFNMVTYISHGWTLQCNLYIFNVLLCDFYMCNVLQCDLHICNVLLCDLHMSNVHLHDFQLDHKTDGNDGTLHMIGNAQGQTGISH